MMKTEPLMEKSLNETDNVITESNNKIVKKLEPYKESVVGTLVTKAVQVALIFSVVTMSNTVLSYTGSYVELVSIFLLFVIALLTLGFVGEKHYFDKKELYKVKQLYKYSAEKDRDYKRKVAGIYLSCKQCSSKQHNHWQGVVNDTRVSTEKRMAKTITTEIRDGFQKQVDVIREDYDGKEAIYVKYIHDLEEDNIRLRNSLSGIIDPLEINPVHPINLTVVERLKDPNEHINKYNGENIEFKQT